MDRERAFPTFEDAWIVHRDDALIVVDKPPFVPFQATDATRDDDLVGRLRRHLERAGEQGYLGIHQRLDKDTSGLVLFVRDKNANARIAAQFESRSIKKTYLACVTGWPRGRDRATLRDALAEGEGGKIRVAPGRATGAKLAVTHVRVVDRRGERALLELVLETGRTHQARVQLAHAGAPIAGDVLYAGARAPRLMLHAHALELEHPRGGRLALRSGPPADLSEWLERGDLGASVFDDDAALRRALSLAAAKRWALAHASDTTCFRLVHEEGDALPALAVDVYGDHFVAQLHASSARDADDAWADPARRTRVLDALAALGPDGVYLKLRPRQANVLVDTRREEVAPALPVRGTPAPDPLIVREGGLELGVRLGDGLSTGLFLDQRGNRARVRAASAGKRVLNLFSYTCAFTAAAFVGGAVSSTSVDASPSALERGRENLLRAGADLARHVLVADDAFAYLARAARKGERFDLVVLDPPSYSSTRARRFVADSDYGDLAAAALALLAPHGELLACTNHRGIHMGRFRKLLRRAAEDTKRVVLQLKDLTTGVDFPTAPGADPTMKSAWLRLGN